MKITVLLGIVAIYAMFNANVAVANTYNLPDLGDSSSIVSLQQEYDTGQSWLRAFRRQAPINEDPLIYDYLQDLTQRLAFFSPIIKKQFDLVVVDSPAFNAFAVPGNVIGINTGLFDYAETEDQLSSVIAHELAHLSQRHYARTLGRKKKQNLSTLAALLGSLLVLAAGDAEAGIAALTATQAAAISNQLKYSRLQEQEADRIGMQILANAGMNPAAVAHMFQHILVTTRYRKDIKEVDFLLTHPLPESRVSDAFNHARQYTSRSDEDSFNFHLIKSRITFLNHSNAKHAIQQFEAERAEATFPKAIDYGIALAALKDGQMNRATAIIDKLYKDSPHQIAFALAKIDLLHSKGLRDEAISLANQHLSLSPNNYPLSMMTANLLLQYHHPQQASDILRSLVDSGEPNTPDIWYLLAEVEGLAGNIAQVHLARAEHFVLIGAFSQALRHLNLCIPLLNNDIQARNRVNIRIKQVEQLRKNQKF